jgi:hypothetical protein
LKSLPFYKQPEIVIHSVSLDRAGPTATAGRNKYRMAGAVNDPKTKTLSNLQHLHASTYLAGGLASNVCALRQLCRCKEYITPTLKTHCILAQ